MAEIPFINLRDIPTHTGTLQDSDSLIAVVGGMSTRRVPVNAVFGSTMKRVSPPHSQSSEGSAGQIAVDNTGLYVYGDNAWLKVPVYSTNWEDIPGRALLVDKEMQLSDAEKNTARENIGAVDAVPTQYDPAVEAWVEGTPGLVRVTTRIDDTQNNAVPTLGLLKEALEGNVGKSAFEIWLEQPGNEGKTEADFIEAITGPQGEQGEQGETGQAGAVGKSAYEVWVEMQGNTGKSKTAFFDSLRGSVGPTGIPGIDGARGQRGLQGVTGMSAYDEWIAQGNVGSKQVFIASLKGNPGVEGPPGEDGETGPTGPTGIPGPPGGPTGPQGPTGPVGPTGTGGSGASAHLYVAEDEDGNNSVCACVSPQASTRHPSISSVFIGKAPASFDSVGMGAVVIDPIGAGGTDGKGLGSYSVAVGAYTYSAAESVAVGRNARAFDGSSVAIGTNAYTADGYSTAVGFNARSDGTYSIALGAGTQAIKDNAIAIGDGAEATELNTIAIGPGTKAQAEGSITIGNHATSSESAHYGIAIGVNAHVLHSGAYGVAIGAGAKVVKTAGIAIGYAAHASEHSVAIGTGAGADGYSIALGAHAYAGHLYSTAIGYRALARESVLALSAYNESTDTLSQMYLIPGDANEPNPSPRLGFAIFRGDTASPDTLVASAAIAMHDLFYASGASYPWQPYLR